MNDKIKSFGVITKNALIKNTNFSRSQVERTVLPGVIAKIQEIIVKDKLIIKILKDDKETWEDESFYCDESIISFVGEEIWPFLASVVSAQDRVKIAKNSELCSALANITLNSSVVFTDNDIYIGVVKFKGSIKGFGKGFGILLHEKKPGNRCDGSCAGVKYFTCESGYGLFTTIEKIVPYLWYTVHSAVFTKESLLTSDKLAEKYVQKIITTSKSSNLYSQEIFHDNYKLSNSVNLKASVSLQDIYELSSSNTNNDFDQNTIIQADNVKLLNFEMDEKLNIDLCAAASTNEMQNNSKLTERYADNSVSVPSTSTKKKSPINYYPPDLGTTGDLSIGTLVEIKNDSSNELLYGVIKWMGVDAVMKRILVGVELEDEQTQVPLNLTDGTYNGKKYFKCSENRGVFVWFEQCKKDSRFLDGTHTSLYNSDKIFGKDCPIIEGAVSPLCMPTEEDVDAVCGKFRGIQGHHNSCYLDATLFAMFTFTAVVDSLLFRPRNFNDIPRYEEVQRVLREEIVNPLRSNLYVRADRVMDLRKLLDQLSSVSGMTSEEKDPEEFLNCLLAQILKAEPFLKLNSGQESYYYQLFVEKDDELSLPTVQQLFEQSFLSSDIKLREVPSCLIIQMPRFGKNYKMYPRILPSQLLDVTDVIDDSPRQCTVCGQLAKWECRDCFGECEEGLASTAFCDACLTKIHAHKRRSSHNPRSLPIPQDYMVMAEHCSPPRLFMELFAVVCIETSHYVSFVKCGSGHEAPWCFFDSMADRKGEQNGYNIPEMVACPDVSKWLSDEQYCRMLHENSPSDRYLPEHARRLLCDAYICMYQSPDVMIYK